MHVEISVLRQKVEISLRVEPLTKLTNNHIRAAKSKYTFLKYRFLGLQIFQTSIDYRW